MSSKLEQKAAEVVSAIRSINRSRHQQITIKGDDEPCYWQRKEWIDWILDLANDLELEIANADCIPPAEFGTNRYGVDVGYFRRTINRELNRGLGDFKPDELARVFARLSVTANKNVIHEPEFSAKVAQ